MNKNKTYFRFQTYKKFNRNLFTGSIFFTSVVYRVALEATPETIKFRAIETLSSLQAYSMLKNPLILKNTETTGSELLFTSLPIRIIYEIAYGLKLDAITAMQLHIVTEIVFQNIVLGIAISLLIKNKYLRVFQTLAFFNFFQIVSPINLANWGFIYGWNYGFAYSSAILAVVLAIKKKLGPLFLTVAILFSIHFTVGITVSILVIFLILLQLKQFQISRKETFYYLGALIPLIFTLASISNSSNKNYQEINERFLDRIKLFQVHLFVDLFNPESIMVLVPILLHWVAIFSTTLMVVNKIKSELPMLREIEIVLHFIFFSSILACIYSQMNKIDSTIILIAFHRLSILVPYFFLILIPIFFGESVRKFKMEFFMMMMILIIHIVGVSPFTSGLSFAISLITIGNNAKQQTIAKKDGRIGKLIILLVEALFMVYICSLFMYFYLPKIIAIFIVFIIILVLFFATKVSVDFESIQPKFQTFLLVIMIPFAIVGIFNDVNNHSDLLDQNVVDIESYYEMEIWAKSNTPLDAVFLLPPDNEFFGWESFSERASTGKPMEWLHYSILYSRDENAFQDGTRKIKLYGVDIEDTKSQNTDKSNIALGNLILNQIYANYKALTDQDLKRIAVALEANYFITENREIDHEDVTLVKEINKYRIYKIQ